MSDKPIINSLLQTDFYKLPMDWFGLKHLKDVEVVYRFINRTTSVRLADIIDIGELREQLDHVRTLKFTRDDLHWIAGTYEYDQKFMFPPEFIEFLKDLSLPEYHLEKKDGQFILEFPGPEPYSSNWEIPALTIVNTLLNRARMKGMTRSEVDALYSEGKIRLAQNIREIKRYSSLIAKHVEKNPKFAFTFSDFGTRRCFSPEWQDYVVEMMAEELPQEFRGTSNCYLAKKHGLTAMGTVAHQPIMIMAALAGDDDDKLRQASYEFCRLWAETFGQGLRIILPDTYGSEPFWEQAPFWLSTWRGFRGDSGDLFMEGTRGVKWFQKNGADLTEKLYIPSDGLLLPLMFKLHKHFAGRIITSDSIPTTDGWGSSLTNNMTNWEVFKPVSIVVKPASANGYPTVKLSNNISKAMGEKKDIERCKRVFKYTSNYNQAPTY